jgi:hypothetical protein
MSSGLSLPQLLLARENVDKRRPTIQRKPRRTLSGQLARIAGNFPPELKADLGTAAAGRADGPFRRSALTSLLFRSTFPVHAGDVPALQPIFAAEAMSRARTMFGLVLLLEEKSWSGDEPWYPDASPLTLRLELTLAQNIVSLFDRLGLEGGHDARPCDTLLGGILSGFIALFGPGIGRPSLELEADPVPLAGYKRRALVLAAAQLVNQAMLHNLPRPHHGQFRAILRTRADGKGEFILEHDGRNVELVPPGDPCSGLGAMAALLEAEMVCRRSATGGHVVELRFPC